MDRVDFAKAINLYKMGYALRCPRCVQYLATSYEEDVEGGVLKQDVRRVTVCYRRGLRICEDENDAAIAKDVADDLAALYITWMKMAETDSEEDQYHHLWLQKLQSAYPLEQRLVRDVEKDLLNDVNGGNALSRRTGKKNAERLIERAKPLAQAERQSIAAENASGDVGCGSHKVFKHVFGSACEKAKKRTN